MWKFKVGGGFLVGKSGDQQAFSGPEIAYVYPDKLTSLVGHFDNGTLVKGWLHELTHIEFNDKAPIFPTPRFRRVHSDTNHQTSFIDTFTYEPSNQTYLGRHPLKRDPYEEKYLYVGNSTINGAGRGIFLKRNVIKGEVVGFYNGVRLTGLESKLKYEDRKSPYRIDNDWAVPDQIINIPPQYRYNYRLSMIRFTAALLHYTW